MGEELEKGDFCCGQEKASGLQLLYEQRFVSESSYLLYALFAK